MYTIQFQTAPNTPPPFCYQAICQLSFGDEGMQVDLQIQYFGREELSPNEILAEGFSEDDDISWQGTLPKTWVKAFNHIHGQATWMDDPQGQNYLGLLKEDGEVIFPQRYEVWEEWLQELIQAAHEEIGTAIPMDIKIWRPQLQSLIVLRPIFKSRKVKIQIGQEEKYLQWHAFTKLMSILFVLELNPDLATRKQPKSDGLYFSYQDQQWFALGKSAIDLSQDGEVRRELLRLIDSYMGDK